MGATAAVLGGLLLFPTSRGAGQVGPAQTAAPAGIVASASPGASPSAVAAPVVVNGSAVDTRFGPVQVQITIKDGKIVDAAAISYPQGSGRDQEINSYAIPVLQQETVAAQSAQIDTVSGATYTSAGYVQSLQAALDAAHL
jgi:uncharacterized protein with FMN-binding domain